MAAASYYDQPSATQEVPSHPHMSQSTGVADNATHNPNPAYTGQQQMGNNNYVQGASQQQMNGNANAAGQVDNRDTLTKCNDNPPDYMNEFHTVPSPLRPCAMRPSGQELALATDHRSSTFEFLIDGAGVDVQGSTESKRNLEARDLITRRTRKRIGR